MHPLNKTWTFASIEIKNWFWNQEFQCFEATSFGLKEYALGDRLVDKPHENMDSFRTFLLHNDGFIGGGKWVESKQEALEWLYGANHKEYGCRLWCKE